MEELASPYSAAEQGLGYIFQPRFALLKLLELSESSAVLIEKEDDVDFISEGGMRSLGSLKHKAPGDTLTDLSTDFWKSVRIWLAYYRKTGGIGSDGRFFLFSTAKVAERSFLAEFTDRAGGEDRVTAAQNALARSKSELIGKVRDALAELDGDQQRDFFDRITILVDCPIQRIP